MFERGQRCHELRNEKFVYLFEFETKGQRFFLGARQSLNNLERMWVPSSSNFIRIASEKHTLFEIPSERNAITYFLQFAKLFWTLAIFRIP